MSPWLFDLSKRSLLTVTITAYAVSLLLREPKLYGTELHIIQETQEAVKSHNSRYFITAMLVLMMLCFPRRWLPAMKLK